MKRVTALCWSCWFVAACSPAPDAPPPASPIVRTPPTAQRAPSPPAPDTPEASETSPFHVIGELPVAYLSLQSAGDRGFLLSQRGIELSLIGDEVVQDPLLKRGLPGIEAMYRVNAIAGRFPDAAWLSTSHPYERTGFSTLWTWEGKRWKKKLSTNPGLFIESVQPWVGGRLLALEQSGMWFEASFRVLSGDTRVALPRFVKTKKNDDFIFCQTEMRVEAFATLPSGEVFAAGQSCDAQGNIEVAVKRWAAGDTRGKLDVLPGTRAPADPQQSEWHITGLAVHSPRSVFVSGSKVTWHPETRARQETPYFAHFDGASWQPLPSPIAGGVQALWLQADGVLYGSDAQGALFRGSASAPQAPWTRVPFPSELIHDSRELAKLAGFWLRAPGDAWALVKVGVPGEGERDYLLHTRPPANELPTIEAFTRRDAELALPGPPVDWCTTPFVLLYTLGRNAPAAYDYPATRAALKGHDEFAAEVTFIEFSREGRRYFGARVPDFKLGKQLASLVRAKVPGATPQLVCHAPAASRTFPIDLKTGELSAAASNL